MSRSSCRRSVVPLALGIWILSASASSADCPPQDLTAILNTGWDESTGAVIPAGGTDDDWDVILDASGGTVPSDAGVISPSPAWLTLPNSAWLAADKYGPNGTYRYRTCWCMDDDFANPNLSFAIRADDQADVFLNGTLVQSLPTGTFNDAIALGISVVNPALFNVGVNCLEVVVQNLYGGPTGFNLTGSVTADDGLCCDCREADILDDASTGVVDYTGDEVASGSDDDEWVVTSSASGGLLPRPADAVGMFSGWDLIPGTKWISADVFGPGGLYTYEKCWCMNPFFQNPQLSMQLLADDRADVFLNGTLIGSTPSPGSAFPATSISTSDASLFRSGKNCVTIEVHNVGSPTGLDVAMTIRATNAECCPCTELPPDAEGWWPLDEAAGPTAAELLHGHDGTWLELGSLGLPPFAHLGEWVDNSLTLDGIDDYVEVPDHPGLDFGGGQDFSFDAWIKTGSPVRQAILHKKVPGPPSSPGYSFDVGGVLSLEIADGSGSQVCVGTTNVADDAWHFVAATVDRDLVPGGIKLYVDGVVEPSSCNPTLTGSLANAQQLYFGAAPPNPVSSRMWWKGQLDEIEIFRRALTPGQVAALHGALNSGKCLPEPEPPPQCGRPGDFTCDEACPEGQVCQTAGNGCACVPVVVPCGDTSYPQCDGDCPQGEVCGNIVNTDRCACRPQPVACVDSPYPACPGACPANQECKPAPNQTCGCIGCGTGNPSGPTVVNLAPGKEIRWTPVTCALVYNLYRGSGARMTDQNADGLADDYGSCHIGDIIDTRIKDPLDPQPGAIHWYLVTAENFAGEGSMGANSHGQPRQPTGVCP